MKSMIFISSFLVLQVDNNLRDKILFCTTQSRVTVKEVLSRSHISNAIKRQYSGQVIPPTFTNQQRAQDQRHTQYLFLCPVYQDVIYQCLPFTQLSVQSLHTHNTHHFTTTPHSGAYTPRRQAMCVHTRCKIDLKILKR